ncbi:hypothetical protein GDO78_020832 [Eleutherodactylus coqui]|uniref:Ig-like domain-containing protein n=1 Tax=Eleutherodactylus coqui TaxID=57060 RepID=A0A8J6EHW3_ELECQ|nr:hypothetical protein GDO78_020832 [Eleutherodactylus coqui]
MDPEAAVTWTVNGTDIDNSQLNGSALLLHTVDLSYNGFYSCFEGSPSQLWHQTTLKVGHPPKELALLCRSNNYPASFYCSWHLPSPTYIPNYFNITVKYVHPIPSTSITHNANSRRTQGVKLGCAP